MLGDPLRADDVVDPGLDVPDAPLLVVDALAAVGRRLHRALDRLEVGVVLGHHDVEAIEAALPLLGVGHRAVAPVGREPHDVETGLVDGGRPEHQEGETAASSGRDHVGEDAVRGVGREEQLGRALEGRDELALVAPAHLACGVQRRDHALVAVRVQRHHRATTVEAAATV